jgi:NAD(P)H-hydrate epimerase
MALRPLSRTEVRELDRRAIEEYGVPGIVLMENAGREAAGWLVELGIDGPVLICCGKGNNGGDGYVMARHLESWGHKVHVLLACDPADFKGDALVNYQILRTSGTPVTIWSADCTEPRIDELFRNADWVVDGLLGTGAQGELRGPLRLAIETINSCDARKFAIDIPSGLDCDTGRPLGCAVRASYTATFVAPKIGFTNPESAAYTGRVRVFDIGMPARLLQEFAA